MLFRSKKSKNTKSQKKVVSQLERIEERELLRLQPLQWNPAPVLSGQARYTATSAVGGLTLSIKELLSMPGLMCTTTVLAYPTCVAARLRKVQVWGFVATAGTPVSVKLQKAGIDSTGNDFNDSFRQVQDSSNSFDRPAFCEMSFDKFTPSGSFHTTEAVSGNLLTMTCPSGSVIDYFYSYVPGWSNSPSATTFVVTNVAGATGRVSLLSNNLTPASVNRLD